MGNSFRRLNYSILLLLIIPLTVIIDLYYSLPFLHLYSTPFFGKSCLVVLMVCNLWNFFFHVFLQHRCFNKCGTNGASQTQPFVTDCVSNSHARLRLKVHIFIAWIKVWFIFAFARTSHGLLILTYRICLHGNHTVQRYYIIYVLSLFCLLEVNYSFVTRTLLKS